MNHICNITGCVAALVVGAWSRNAKADYTNIDTVKAHWEAHPKLFSDTFNALFRQSIEPPLLSAYLLSGNRTPDRDLYWIFDGSESAHFDVPAELRILPGDAVIKKIYRVLGSREFLRAALLDANVDAVINVDTEPNSKTRIYFRPYSDAWGTQNRILMRMVLRQTLNGQTAFEFRFWMVFKKEEQTVSLAEYRATCQIGNRKADAWYKRKPEALPDFPRWSCVKDRIKNIPNLYRTKFAGIDTRKMKTKWEMEKKWDVRIVEGLHVYTDYVFCKGDAIEANAQRFLAVLTKEDFLVDIFGADLWNGMPGSERVTIHGIGGKVKVHYFLRNTSTKDKKTIDVRLDIEEKCEICKEDGHIPFSLDDSGLKTIELNGIHLLFTWNAQSDEIENIRLRGTLTLNGQTLTVFEGEEKIEDC